MGALSGKSQRRQAEQAAARQEQQLAQLREDQRQQANAVADREERTRMVEEAQRRVRRGRARGLLTVADDQALGGAT